MASQGFVKSSSASTREVVDLPTATLPATPMMKGVWRDIISQELSGNQMKVPGSFDVEGEKTGQGLIHLDHFIRIEHVTD